MGREGVFSLGFGHGVVGVGFVGRVLGFDYLQLYIYIFCLAIYLPTYYLTACWIYFSYFNDTPGSS